jgi:uncharacterized membrane protein
MSQQPKLSSQSAAGRVLDLDALRGLIMIFMALDHANLLVAQKHPPSEMWGGAFPVYYSVVAFLTRFVTHLCAPGFFFLMGIGMVLFAHSRQERGWSRAKTIRHFWLRGGVIIALKLLIVNQIWKLSPGGWGIQVYVGVLIALAGTMMLGSLLLWLRPAHLLVVTLGLVLGMELLLPDPSRWGPGFGLLELVLLVPGGIVGSQGEALLWSNYPILPWLELTTLGMLFGHWLTRNPTGVRRHVWKIGAAFLAAFALLRFLNGFGNIRPRMGNTWMDFLTPVKYPPSITFVLLTIGLDLIIWSVLWRLSERAPTVLQPLAVFGRTPFFFYVMHLMVYIALGYLFTPAGTSIPTMYPYWLLGLVILFPLCWWYERLKRSTSSPAILQYL